MSKPKKLKNGKWRVQVYLGKRDGKQVRVTVTADTKRECQDKAAFIRAKGIPEKKVQAETLGTCIDRYIESSETLSPTTLAGYRKIRRTMFQDLMDVPVDELNSDRLQRAINAEMRRKSRRGHNISPKSIRNAYGLVSASCRVFYDKVFNVRLPESDPTFLELPEPEFVMAKLRGTDIELPCMLSLWLSLSMSEIRGLKYSSIRNGCIYIDQVVVDVDGEVVEKKKAKVASRNRVLALPEPLLELIKKQTGYEDYLKGKIFDDYLIHMPSNTIYKKLQRLVPGLSPHKLRHMNASVMLALNIPEKYAMERGGWSTPETMKRVYEHTFSTERQRVDALIDDYFSQKLHKMSEHEAANR